jgi:hypothetical protein
MLIPVSIIFIVLLLCWSKRREGLTQSCTDQRYLQQTCNSNKPAPFCANKPMNATTKDEENGIECIPLPKDGKCPASFPNGSCPEWFDSTSSSCLTNTEFSAKTGIR